MALDGLPVESLRSLDKYRQKFNFLYLCKSCARSFDSMDPVSRCKFCSSDGPEVLDMKSSKVMYRYYCPKCERNRLSEKHEEKCAKCGSRFIHTYKWGKKSRKEFARMRARSLMGTAKSRAYILRSNLRNAIKKKDDVD